MSDQGWTSPSGEPTEPPPPPTYEPYQPSAADPRGPNPAQPPYPPAAPYGGYLFARPNGKANTAMGLGIASVVSALLTPFCCVTVVGVLCGPVAIGIGVTAKREIRAAPGTFNNEGAATAGFICGIVGTVIGVLMIAAVAAFFGFAYSV